MTCGPFRSAVIPDSSAAALVEAARDVSAPYIWLGGAAGLINPEALDEAARILEAGRFEVALVPLAGYEWISLLADLPGAVLARVPQVVQGSLIVVPREQLLSSGPRTGSNESVHGILARLADARCRIHVWTSTWSKGGPLTEFTPPALVPDRRESLNPGLEQFLEFDPQGVAPVQSREDVTALQSGLFQVHDALERSHTLAQSIEGRGRHRAGDYWHAIMHRREPDYTNAKYWFRHVGAHPIDAELASRASQLLASSAHADVAQWRSRLALPGRWDSAAFVDLCEQAAADESGPLGMIGRRIQWTEILLLLNSTCQDAFGGR